MMNKNNYKFLVVGILFFVFGFYMQNAFSSEKSFSAYIPNNVNKDDFVLFWDVWKTMEKKYPFEEPTESEKRYAAIKGLVDSYNDDYSVFLTPEQAKSFNESVSGEFVGAGMEIAIRDKFLVVIAPLKNSPAERAGLKAGDIITKVDGNFVIGKTLGQIVSEIKGEVGTEVVLTVFRSEFKDPIDITVTRDVIEIPVLKTEIDRGVFVISLYNFNNNSQDRFKEALIKFKKSKSRYLLIDLSNNPGGALFSSTEISSYFLRQGKIIVKENFGDTGKDERIHRSKGYDLLKNVNYKLGIIINKGSASASEIIAGALQDNKKAVIIGEKSFGKGSVQELIQMDQKTSLKVTIGKWLTPKNRQISKEGIIPDIELNNMSDSSLIRTDAINTLKDK